MLYYFLYLVLHVCIDIGFIINSDAHCAVHICHVFVSLHVSIFNVNSDLFAMSCLKLKQYLNQFEILSWLWRRRSFCCQWIIFLHSGYIAKYKNVAIDTGWLFGLWCSTPLSTIFQLYRGGNGKICKSSGSRRACFSYHQKCQK